MSKRKQTELIRGNAKHRRTEGDYMGVLLDTVTLEDWQSVVTSAMTEAKNGDPKARNWLAQYLIGRPEGRAPTPLTIVVQQLNGTDPLIDRLAKAAIDRHKYPSLHQNDEWETNVKALFALELNEKISNARELENPALARAPGESDSVEGT